MFLARICATAAKQAHTPAAPMLACQMSTKSRKARKASKAPKARKAVSTVAPEDYKGSENYVPGKQGYAPGFPPPKKWSDKPREPRAAVLAADLPAPQDPLPIQTPAYRFKEDMRNLRKGYLLEHVQRKEDKVLIQANKLEHVRAMQAERREKLRAERLEYETKVRADPLSAENVLNAEGLTLLGNVAETAESSSKEEPGYKLAPPRVTISIPAEANARRNEERKENRDLTNQMRHEDNVQAMMTLFHEAESFVTYENMDQKIDDFLESLSISQRSLSEMLDNLQGSHGVISPDEVSMRSIELRNILQGTTGPQGRLGHDGLEQWLENHPEDAQGIQNLDLLSPSAHSNSTSPTSSDNN
ncbi:hypothetical protein GGI07_000356 [Coemansia sp. Benny D115]|nr:hypothetical protein GGI07_000356 [Coemansia sp. Benny D115]